MSPDFAHAPCPACAGADGFDLIHIESIPVLCNVQWPTRAEAVAAARGSMRLRFCSACSHVFNAAFDPRLIDYVPDYENSLHYSPHFSRWADRLADRLIERHALAGAHVVEIGCGDGEFLDQLCSKGAGTGAGFDRSLRADTSGSQAGVKLYARDAQADDYAGSDLIACRHVLEHMDAPRDFVAALRDALPVADKPALYFEVPNVAATLEALAIWDLIYEHVSYFSADSLFALFTRAGFDCEYPRAEFDGQFLALDGSARAASATPPAPGTMTAATDFGTRYREKLGYWQNAMDAAAHRGKGVAVWGAGSKGVTFLNALGLTADGPVQHVVDLNPRKHGRFVAGTGQEIVAPQALLADPPELIVVMNPVYTSEISELCADLGLRARLEAA